MADVARNAESSSYDETTSSAARPGDVAQAPSGKLTFHVAASAADVVRLKDLAVEYHSESRFAHIPFSEEKYLKVFTQNVEHPGNVSFYACMGEKPVATIGGLIGDYFVGEGGRMATTYIFYVSRRLAPSLLAGRAAVRLLHLFSSEAKAKGALEMHVHSNGGISPERTDRFLQRVGLQVYGGNYFVRLI